MIQKHICLFIDTFSAGGAERVCINYANELSEVGYKVTILVFNLSKQYYIDELNDSIKVESLNVANGVRSFNKLLRKKTMLKSFDVFITFNHQISLLLYTVKLILCINNSLVARNVNNLALDLKSKKGNPFKRALTQFMMFCLYKKMDAYIAQCNAMKEDMIECYSIPQEKITVVYNPISPKFKKIALKKDIDILFVGRLTQQKGIDNLIKIISEAHKLLPHVKLHIVGQGDLKDELISSLEVIGVNYTHDLQSSDLINLYNRSKVTILTSYYEGYPNVLVESIACGTPVVSFDCKSGPSEIINDGVNGYLINSFDIALFVFKMIELISSNIDVKSTKKKETEKLIALIEKL